MCSFVLTLLSVMMSSALFMHTVRAVIAAPLLPGDHNKQLMKLLYRTTEWHAVAKARMDTDLSLEFLERPPHVHAEWPPRNQ